MMLTPCLKYTTHFFSAPARPVAHPLCMALPAWRCTPRATLPRASFCWLGAGCRLLVSPPSLFSRARCPSTVVSVMRSVRADSCMRSALRSDTPASPPNENGRVSQKKKKAALA